MTSQIRFGDIVYIEFDNLILFANGIYSPTLHLISPHNIARNSFRNGLFKLYPNLSYKDTHQVEQLKDQLELLKSLHPTETFAAEQLENDIENERKLLEERENRREDLNQKMYEESKGKPILLGHKVQLFHVESQCFVSLSETFNKDGNTINLELSKKGSKKMYFTFMPKLAFNQEGQIVEYDTPIKLISYQSDTFLTKGVEIDLEKVRSVINLEANQLCNSGDDFPRIESRRKEPIYEADRIFQTGMSLKEVPENLYIRRFISIEDDEKAEAGKAIKNGDYIRITNDKHFLTIYQSRNAENIEMFFQSFRGNFDYKYNNLYTLFQILEVDDKKANEDGFANQNSSQLPGGHILEYEEKKRYTLKHVVSGQYLAFKTGNLTLLHPSKANGEEKLSLVLRDNQIDRNSILQFKFYSQHSKEEGILSIGEGIYIGNPQFDTNTLYYIGFANSENYLNKSLRPERFKVKVASVVDEEFSSFKLMKVKEEEFTSILLAESLANYLQKFSDLLDEFLRKKNMPGRTIKELNEAIKELGGICLQFSTELYEEGYNEDIEDILDPHVLRQSLLREFRIYNLMYAIMVQFTSNEEALEIFKEKRKKVVENEGSQNHEVFNSDGEIVVNKNRIKLPSLNIDKGRNETLEENDEFNFASFIDLMNSFKKIILTSFKNNDLNHYYCSQFVRIPIRGLVHIKTSIMSLATSEEQREVMETLLVLCKEGLWDLDLDALGQLNFYETELFECLEQQTDYHSIYLRLLTHISSSKAPNLVNSIRDNLAFSFLSKPGNLAHVFPEIYEEKDKIFLLFQRKLDKEKTSKLCINNISQLSSPKANDLGKNNETEVLLNYFQESLKLIYAVASVKSKGFDFKIVRYYTYPALTKVLDILKLQNQFREIRVAISDLIALIHQGYFAVPFNQIPKQLQILPIGHNEAINLVIDEINQTINSSMKTIISDAETEFIRNEGADEIILGLKSIGSSEEQTAEVIRLIESYLENEKAEVGRIILDEIKKIFESPLEIDFDFFKKSREIVIQFIKQETEKNGKFSYDSIKYALEVFQQLEKKTLVFAATEIADVLKNNFATPSSKKEKKKKSFHKNSSDLSFGDLRANSGNLLEKGNKEYTGLKSNRVTPMRSLNKELSNRENSQDPGMANAVEVLTRKWKTGERFFYGNNNKVERSNHMEVIHKKINTSATLTMLLEIVALNQDYLMKDVIHQLKKVSSFESNLYKELDKLIILQDYESLKKVSQVIKITLRLHEISREVNFCKDNLIPIEDGRLNKIFEEIYEYHWKLFFIIYDVSKHFRYNESKIDPEDRFKNAFEKDKIIQWDYCLKLNPGAINKTFQKIFNILKTNDALIKTQSWVFSKIQNFEEQYYLPIKTIRLNIQILTAFVYKNKENQYLFSNERGIIERFYNQYFMNLSCDVLFLFAETLRDNKKLLKLPIKYQFDIVISSFVNYLRSQITNGASAGYMTANLISYHFLCQVLLPVELFRPLNVLKSKWVEISQVIEFTKLNLVENSENENLPYCYYEVRELMNATLENFEVLSCNAKNLNEMQSFLGFREWIGFFQTSNYSHQFELKNLLTKCLVKFYFDQDTKIKLLENSDNCLALVSSLVADLVFFLEHMSKVKIKKNPELQKLTKTSNFITTHPNYKLVQDFYAKTKEWDLKKKTIKIFLEDISLHNLLREYIYDGCLDLFFNILLKEVESCKEVLDPRDEFKSIIAFALELIDNILIYESDDELFPYSKLEKFLSRASATKGYFSYRSKIIDITNKFHLRVKAKGKNKENLVNDKNESQEVGNAVDNFKKYITPLYDFKKENKEQNMKQVAEHIAEHPQSSDIIKEILNYFKRDIHKLEHEEIIFILRLLRKYIENENSNNPGDDPLYMWKEIAHSDLKKIEKIQNLYRDLGLSEILYSFFTINDQRIFREAILLSLAYMYGGNKDVQLDFFENFKQDDDNRVLSQIGGRLEDCYGFFRGTETKRVNVLYKATQKALFDYFKGKRQNQVDMEELQIKITKLKVDPKYLTVAEKNNENELFILILTFLQVLCEGQYREMQLFLREQKYEDRLYPKSFDFLSFLRHSVNNYHKVLCRYNLSVGLKILDVIIELIQGEVHENIAVFLQKTFIYDLCRVLNDYNARYHTLPRGFGLNLFHEHFGEFKSKIISLFKTMLENKNESNTRILAEHLDQINLMKALENLMTEFIRRNNLQKKLSSLDRFIFSLNNEDFKSVLGDAINIYIIFRYIYCDPNDFNERMRELIKEMDQDKQDFLDKVIFTTFRKLVNSIEIVVESKAQPLMKIWFPVIAMCHYLNKDARYQFIKHVDRSNSQTKISALIDSTQEFIPQMDTDYQARNRIFGFNLLNVYYLLRFITNMIALTVTIINVATYKYEEEDTFQEDRFTKATLGSNIAQIVIAAALAILWKSLLSKRNQTIRWERYVDQNIKKNGFLSPTLKNKLENGEYKNLSRDECMAILTLKGANSEEFKEMQQSSINFKQIAFSYYIIESYFAVASKAFFWHVCYLGVTIGSLFHPLVAVFQILDIAFRVDTIKQIYSSISRNVTQFLWTLFLLVLTNVIYSFIGFFFMNDKFMSEEDPLCETAFSCLLNVLNLGLRSGGGIADVIGSQPYLSEDVGLFIARVVFDLSFFIIMIILLLNLIFGMIIDAFGDLRDQKTSNEEDEKNVCFICGIERSEFEKHMNFEEHTLEEHNIWSYVYYIAYLIEKQKTSKNEMTDIENFVIEKYSISNYEWIPIAQSLTLENILESQQVKKEDELEKVKNKLDNMEQNLKDMNTQIRHTIISEIKGGIKELEEKITQRD